MRVITSLHKSVLLETAINELEIISGMWYVDATFGRGGHTREILNRGGKVVAFDWDEEAIKYGNEIFSKEISHKNLILVHNSFEYITQEIQKLNLDTEKINGILFDFGTSTDQLKSPTRGFSFEGEAELDMRMDIRFGVKAKDILAALNEKQLTNLFREYGGELKAHAIAKSIVAFREKNNRGPETTTELVNIISKFYPRRFSHLHPATKVFQALRIVVNSEIDAINTALPQAIELVQDFGKIVTISFHEGEDRAVKTAFKKWQENKKGEMIYKKPVQPTTAEIETNPNARSAKLRVFKKRNNE